MFTQTWKKYLSVIVILIKRAAKEPQTMQLNLSDFERAAGGRKVKFSFANMVLINGRQQYGNKLPPVATDLVLVLQEQDIVMKMLKTKQLEFGMNGNMELTITDNSLVAESTEAVTDEEKLTEEPVV